jgi:type I restriction enzyme R subunit
MAKHDEGAFEKFIVDSMAARAGWVEGDPDTYDQYTRLLPADLWAFLEATQPEKVETLETRFGATYRQDVEKLIAKELDRRPAGVLRLLRHGIELRSVKLDLAYFRPAHGLTAALQERYVANRLTVVRQLPYSPDHNNTLDVALFVNGLGVATAELKNPLTGQTVEQAKHQYRFDRDEKDPFLSRRAVVHFAVDPDQVFMTTALAGSKTEFRPFNRGSDPTGGGGAGNPAGEAGMHATAYLWEQVWARDAWMDILGRFIHVEEEPGKPPKIIFPRFHQWDAVLRLLDDAKSNGAGNSYLIAHSAGSGKTNTIGWLAHRLASLHGADDKPVFDKVVVITDRKVLDRQLQAKIEQFERKNAAGMVATIRDGSSQLADALQKPGVKVIVTTLQKFPFVLGKVGELPDRRYAVLIDEAHSSQSGETSKKMKQVLAPAKAATDQQELELAAEEDAEYLSTTGEDDVNDAVAASAAARGRQENLSMFAFTATPKAKTLELFGTPTGLKGENGKELIGPFHLYSMRQAIEEGYILDVLENYATYTTYYRLAVQGDDKEVEKSKAAAAAARYASLHPHALGQKAEIIVEHFRERTAKEIGGTAKAMVVTRSRLHAVRYKQAIDAYITSKGYMDVRTLVAFSGQVIDPDAPADPYTETQMNGFPESQTAGRFIGTPPHDPTEYQVMVVAEKFQTGFDAPMLHTMFVDKKLEGVNAVQTLSRLNRTHPGKTSTFVLDFVNDAQDIQDAFRPYYETTLATGTEPEQLTDLWNSLEDALVIQEDDVETFAGIWFALTDPSDTSQHPKLYAALKPCEERFNALDEDTQDTFRTQLNQFVRMYAFLAQVLTYADTTMEKRYALARMLAHRIRDERRGALDLGDDVALEYFRIEAAAAQDLKLAAGGDTLTTFIGEARTTEEEMVLLSELIERLNERFATQFSLEDAVKFESLAAQMAADENVQQQAAANSLENFMLAFEQDFVASVVSWMKDSEDLAVKLLDDKDFADMAKVWLARVVHRQAGERHRDGGSGRRGPE